MDPKIAQTQGGSKFEALLQEVSAFYPQVIDRSEGALSPNNQVARSQGPSKLLEGLRAFTDVELTEAIAYLHARKDDIRSTKEKVSEGYSRALFGSHDSFYVVRLERQIHEDRRRWK